MESSTDSLKRKLRQLKQLELRLRFRYRPVPENPDLVWDSFFSTKGQAGLGVRYSLARLSQMSPEAQKQAFEEYSYWVYFRYYQENGLTADNLHDPRLLALLDLPPFADLADIKQRFRDLAKRHHPDHGGDSEKFMELMQVYEKLTGH
jgi:hypothetical protein